MSNILLSSLVEVTLLLYLSRHALEDFAVKAPHRRHAAYLAVMVAAAMAMVLGWIAHPWLLPLWPQWLTLNPITLEPIVQRPNAAWSLIGQALVVTYGVGVLWLLVRRLGVLCALRHRAARARPVTRGQWFTLLRTLDPTNGRTRLCVTDDLHSPVVWGLLQPTIMLPKRALHWPHTHCAWTLRHELAHIRRRDWLSQQIAYLACILCWPIPAAWRMYADLRLEAERAADDAVLLAGARATEYGQWLLHEAVCAAAPVAVAIHSDSSLAARLHHLLNRYSARSLAGGYAFTSLLIGLLLAQPLVHVQLDRLTIEPLVLHAPEARSPEPDTQNTRYPTLKLVRELAPLTMRAPIERPARPPDAMHQPIPPPHAFQRFD